MSFDQLDFATFCIGSLAQKLEISQGEAYDLLKRYDVLGGYIIPGYGPLHTYGRDYLMENLLEVLAERGAFA